MNDQTKLELLKLSTQLTLALIEQKNKVTSNSDVTSAFHTINNEVFKSFNESKIIKPATKPVAVPD